MILNITFNSHSYQTKSDKCHMISPITVTRAGTYLSKHITFRLGFGTKSAPQVPKLIYWVEVETAGKTAAGIASDFAMVGWFDKGRKEADYLDAMSCAAGHAVETVQSYYNGRPFKPFTAARDRGDEFRDMAVSLGTTRLALQMIEALEGRAILDAISRAYGQNALDLILQHNGFDLHEMGDDLVRVSAGDILYPSSSVPSHLSFRHTVGLDDVIREIDAGEQSLEADIKKYGLNRFKVKIDNRIERSINRLCQMAEVIEKHVGNNYVLTLDGNEAFENWDDLLTFAERFTTHPTLNIMVRNTSYIEQPFHRDNLEKIDAIGRNAIEQLRTKYKLPILIDESGGDHNSYRFAIQNGITGGGFKLCKGLYKAVHDAAVALAHGEGHFNSAEDLTVAEPSDLPQAVHLFGSMRTVRDAELNGLFKTESGTWMTEAEKWQAVKYLPNLFELRGGKLTVKLSGNKYPTGDVLGVGLGSPVVCFDPAEDVPDLRRKIKYTD